MVGVAVVMMDGGYIDGHMVTIHGIKGAKPVNQQVQPTNKHGNPLLGCNSTKSKQYIYNLPLGKHFQMCSDETKDA